MEKILKTMLSILTYVFDSWKDIISAIINREISGVNIYNITMLLIGVATLLFIVVYILSMFSGIFTCVIPVKAKYERSLQSRVIHKNDRDKRRLVYRHILKFSFNYENEEYTYDNDHLCGIVRYAWGVLKDGEEYSALLNPTTKKLRVPFLVILKHTRWYECVVWCGMLIFQFIGLIFLMLPIVTVMIHYALIG